MFTVQHWVCSDVIFFLKNLQCHLGNIHSVNLLLMSLHYKPMLQINLHPQRFDLSKQRRTGSFYLHIQPNFTWKSSDIAGEKLFHKEHDSHIRQGYIKQGQVHPFKAVLRDGFNIQSWYQCLGREFFYLGNNLLSYSLWCLYLYSAFWQRPR